MDTKKRAQAALRSVLPRISPSAKEREEDMELAHSMIAKLRRTIPREVEVRLMGSAAKGTSLRGNKELDIFLLFPKTYPHDKMCKLGLQYAKKAFRNERTQLRYAQHPYLNVLHKQYSIDVVPAYKIRNIEEKGSAVDRSQLHEQYVNARMSQQQKGDVLLLKQFLKTLGVYGAELRIEGFSGYLCELLILHYGSILSLFEEAGKWKKPIIDLAGHHTGKTIPPSLDAPMVAIDPVDPNRNVAAVISQTSLSRFIFECRCFLQRPSVTFFFKERQLHEGAKIAKAIAARKTHVLGVKFAAPPVVDDILWPQLKKTSLALIKHLQLADFEIFGYYHWSDGKECVLLLEVACGTLPAVKRVNGPAVSLGHNCEKFVQAHRHSLNLHIEHERLVAVEARRLCTVEEAIKDALSNPVKIGAPTNFVPLLKRYSLLSPAQLLQKKYLEFVGDYFTRRIA